MFNIKRFFRLNNPFGVKVKSNGLKKRFNWKKARFWTVRILIVFLAFIFLLFAWFAKDLPTPGKIKRLQAVSSTQIFDRNGKSLYAFHGDIRRLTVNSSDIPLVAKQATISAEDRNFYYHLGLDFKGIARALWRDITHRTGSYQGGSTLTQQYVKNALLDSKQTLPRKIKEAILAVEIEIMYSKEDILTMYMNEVPYGSNAYGVQAAAQTYFNKDAKDLSLAESATLAALLKAPTRYSPYGTHPDLREKRVNYVLDSMVEMKYINSDDAEKAKLEAKNLKYTEPKEFITAPHFVMYIKEMLVDKYGEQRVEEGGLKVTTTLDLDKQKIAEEVVGNAASGTLNDINASNAALVSVDPKTGQIISMVGSADFFNKDIDGQVNVADSLRQPGSSFKPIVYATAFKEKYNPAFTLWDVSTDFGNYRPKNYDGSTHGPVSMRTALAGSLNIPAVKTLYLAGLDKSIETAHEMGITSLNQKDRYGLSLVLGGGEVKLTELTGAYGVFANEGNFAETTPILKIEDVNGKVLEEYHENIKNVLDPQVAFEISSILADNDARSYIFGSRSALFFGDRPAAVKTGTTSEYRDAWTVGYTPQVVTGVWVGNNNNKPMNAGAAGAMAAAPIWRAYMERVLENQPIEDFIRPNGIQTVTVDKYSNKLPTEASPETTTDIFTSWQVPTERDDTHISVLIDKLTGKKATNNCPAAFTELKTFTEIHSEVPDNPSWEGPVREVAEAMGINVSFPPTEESCAGLTSKPKIDIISPANNAVVASNIEVTPKVSSPIEVTKVEYFVDSRSVGVSNTSPYSLKINNLSKGKHKLYAVVTNAAGSDTSNTITINVLK